MRGWATGQLDRGHLGSRSCCSLPPLSCLHYLAGGVGAPMAREGKSDRYIVWMCERAFINGSVSDSLPPGRVRRLAPCIWSRCGPSSPLCERPAGGALPFESGADSSPRCRAESARAILSSDPGRMSRWLPAVRARSRLCSDPLAGAPVLRAAGCATHRCTGRGRLPATFRGKSDSVPGRGCG